MRIAGRILTMGLITWLMKKSLLEGDCGRWGRRGLEWVLLCRGLKLVLEELC